MDYYDATEELVTFGGNRVKSSQGPRKKIKRVHLNFSLIFTRDINKKRLEMFYLKHTGYVLN